MKNRLAFAAGLLAMSASLFAHHSPVMFDMTKTQTLEGTVVEFQWTNPHSSIQLDVQTPNGVERWGVEMGSPNSMVKGGWRNNSVAGMLPWNLVVLAMAVIDYSLLSPA